MIESLSTEHQPQCGHHSLRHRYALNSRRSKFGIHSDSLSALFLLDDRAASSENVLVLFCQVLRSMAAKCSWPSVASVSLECSSLCDDSYSRLLTLSWPYPAHHMCTSRWIYSLLLNAACCYHMVVPYTGPFAGAALRSLRAIPLAPACRTYQQAVQQAANEYEQHVRYIDRSVMPSLQVYVFFFIFPKLKSLELFTF